jgi:hypothetical protein
MIITKKLALARAKMYEQGILTHAQIDDICVTDFSLEMMDKLEKARDKGRGGWHSASIEYLEELLLDHISKGDMRDVANIAMFIYYRKLMDNTSQSKGE